MVLNATFNNFLLYRGGVHTANNEEIQTNNIIHLLINILSNIQLNYRMYLKGTPSPHVTVK